MNTGEILRAAAQRLRQHGWQQWSLGRESGPNCAVGALCFVTGQPVVTMGDVYTCDAAKAIVAALDLPTPHSSYHVDLAGVRIAIWNNAAERTDAQVIDGLERAAEWWDERNTPAIAWTHRERELVGQS